MRISAVNNYNLPVNMCFSGNKTDKNHASNTLKTAPVVALLVTAPVMGQMPVDIHPVQRQAIILAAQPKAELTGQKIIKKATLDGQTCLIEKYSTNACDSCDSVLLTFKRQKFVPRSDGNGNFVEKSVDEYTKIKPTALKTHDITISGGINQSEKIYSVIGSGTVTTDVIRDSITGNPINMRDKAFVHDVTNKEIRINKALYDQLKDLLGNSVEYVNESTTKIVGSGRRIGF